MQITHIPHDLFGETNKSHFWKNPLGVQENLNYYKMAPGQITDGQNTDDGNAQIDLDSSAQIGPKRSKSNCCPPKT